MPAKASRRKSLRQPSARAGRRLPAARRGRPLASSADGSALVATVGSTIGPRQHLHLDQFRRNLDCPRQRAAMGFRGIIGGRDKTGRGKLQHWRLGKSGYLYFGQFWCQLDVAGKHFILFRRGVVVGRDEIAGGNQRRLPLYFTQFRRKRNLDGARQRPDLECGGVVRRRHKTGCCGERRAGENLHFDEFRSDLDAKRQRSGQELDSACIFRRWQSDSGHSQQPGCLCFGDAGDSTWTATAQPATGAWSCAASSADGSRLAIAYAASTPGYVSTSSDSGATWHQQTSTTNAAWSCLASSANGSKFVGAVNGGLIYTSSQGNTTTGAAGYLFGAQQSAIELDYAGNGIFIPLSHEGTIRAY